MIYTQQVFALLLSTRLDLFFFLLVVNYQQRF